MERHHNPANWLNHNKELLRLYRGQWIAFTGEGLVAHNETIEGVRRKANEQIKEYLLFFAWIIEGLNQEAVIGRQVVFNAFDIEFKQAEEQIIFKFRGAKTT